MSYTDAKNVYAKYGVDTDAAMNSDKCIPLMDNGHYHPTEIVSDKIPALLTFFPEIALHITRPIRWDSDHVCGNGHNGRQHL